MTGLVNIDGRVQWPPEQVDDLRKMWGQGLSASQIAERLSTTRNTVIGKVHRLGLEKRRRGTQPGEKRLPPKPKPRRTPARKTARKPTPPRPEPVALPPEPLPAPWDGPSIGILDPALGRYQCRCIVSGSGPDTMFCGAPVPEDSAFSFCRFHAATFVTQARPPRSRAATEEFRRTMLAKRREAQAA